MNNSKTIIHKESLFFKYVFALIMSAAALLLTKWIQPAFDTHFFELFQAAVVLSAWYGGRGPGILAAIVSFIIIDYYIIPPIKDWLFNPITELRFIIFGVVAVLTGSISGKLKMAKTELEKRIEELNAAKAELEIVHREEAEKAVVDTSNREQRRLGQDLHDGLGQILAGARFMAQGVREALIERSIPESERMVVLESQLGNALSVVDTISRGLYPVELESHGLLEALTELADKMTNVYSVVCQFKYSTSISVEITPVANHLFRIAQEAVINAIKSGKAKKINIRLFNSKQNFVLSVADNGVGFEKASKRNGMGIKMMEVRSRVINGVLEFRSRQSGGTRVTCMFEGGIENGFQSSKT